MFENDCSSSPVMLFEMGVIGQYGYFVKYLIEYWKKRRIARPLYIVVKPQFVDVYPDVVQMADNLSHTELHFVPISESEDEKITLNDDAVLQKLTKFKFFRRHFRNRIKRFRELLLCKKYVEKMGISHCLIMTFDYYLSFLAMGFDLPCAFSGIYYRPSFHYSTFKNSAPGFKERLKYFFQKLQLRFIFRKDRLACIFLLDPFAVNIMRSEFFDKRVVHLPEPVRFHDVLPFTIEKLKKSLEIEENRVVFLMLGAIGRRRGIHQVLQAVLRMPFSLCEKMCFLFIGPVNWEDQNELQKRISWIRHNLPVQIICRNEIILEEDIIKYFKVSDVVLVTHIRHIGSSGNLIHAAAAQKPVLASDYGLLGELVREFQLGVTVDTTSPENIKKGLTLFVEEDAKSLFSKKHAWDFAQMNSAKRYASMIVENVLAGQKDFTYFNETT